MSFKRLLPSGLRWRLTAWVGLVMAFALALTAFAVYNGTGTEIRRDIDNELRGDVVELANALRSPQASTGTPARVVAARYVTGQPFGATSTLLYVRFPRGHVVTNEPDLFGLRGEDGESVSQQRAEDRLDARLLHAPAGLTTVPLADVGDLRLISQTIGVAGERVRLGVGEPLALVARAQTSVVQAFALAGALALGIALLASILVGALVSAPLRRMAAVAARVDGGDLRPRIPLSAAHDDETRVLAEAFNHMLDRLTTAFAAQRAFVGDASHELRTPLTVIRGQLEVLASASRPDPAEVKRVERLVAAEVTRMSRLADDLLLLTHAEQAEFLRIAEIELVPFIDDLWAGVTATASRHFELGSVPAGVLRADGDRLAQALRNLMANAINHTTPDRGLVRLDVEAPAGGRLRFALADDGPGIAPDQLERVFDRFYRTDSARNRESGGTGLGLAIVRAIAKAHGGQVTAAARHGGGTLILLELGGFTAAPTAPVSSASLADAAR